MLYASLAADFTTVADILRRKKQLNYNTETVFAEDKHTASNEQN